MLEQSEINKFIKLSALTTQKLTSEAFFQLAGKMAGFPFVKIVIEVKSRKVHFINNAKFKLHALYIAKHLLKIPEAEFLPQIDKYNEIFYYGHDRPYYLGIISLINSENNPTFCLETVEVDSMKADMIVDFYSLCKQNIISKYPIIFKPANYEQEEEVLTINKQLLPRIFMHELMQQKSFIPLNIASAKGRIRIFKNYQDYKQNKQTLEWFDIIVMDKVPEDIPRLSGIINSQHTAPLSHTNVLATGWQIPNCIQLGAIDLCQKLNLDMNWASYTVNRNSSMMVITPIPTPRETNKNKPSWTAAKIFLSPPQIQVSSIQQLKDLRRTQNTSYGTKASNLGEVFKVLHKGSHRLCGFYQIERYPRKHLLNYLQKQLGSSSKEDLLDDAFNFLSTNLQVPRGIALPFSLQQEFLISSASIQQTIGKLKMALSLSAKEINAICIELQNKIIKTHFSDKLWDTIDQSLAEHLAGTSSFVIRSSSNAEDLENFSAAGIYESINHVTSSDKILKSIKQVWASLVSPRSILLRHEAGMSLDDCYMGVVIQEEIKDCDLAGVLVTMNPMDPDDYRNVYINASSTSANEIVEGSNKSSQFLFNIIEGSGKILAQESNEHPITKKQKKMLSKLALAGKLLQSHFSKDYTYSQAIDIEWAIKGEIIYILQVRPYQLE